MKRTSYQEKAVAVLESRHEFVAARKKFRAARDKLFPVGSVVCFIHEINSAYSYAIVAERTALIADEQLVLTTKSGDCVMLIDSLVPVSKRSGWPEWIHEKLARIEQDRFREETKNGCCRADGWKYKDFW